MTNDRLDDLLAQAQEREPADDGFTDGVMARVRAGTNGKRHGWRRYVTRPAMLAAAAILVGGGALAAAGVAINQSTDVEADAPTATLEVQGPAQAAADRTTEATARPQREPTPRPSERPMPTPVTRDGARYGYEDENTSFAEHEGVRLTLDTETNEARADEPRRVSLTLKNIGDEPVLITSDGCPTRVFARHDDGGDAKIRDCFSRDREPSRDEQTRIPLAPGEEHTTTAVIVFDEPGQWGVAAVCRCTAQRFDERTTDTSPTPTPRTADRSGTTSLDAQVLDPTQRPEKSPPPEKRRPSALRLVTPPIEIQVS